MKVVAIANQKGGVGKTTTAMNLSAALAKLGKRILIVDLDPQANATSGLGLESSSEQSLYLPLIGQGVAMDRIVPTGRENLCIIPSHMDLAGVEIELARTGQHLTRLRDVIHEIKDSYNFDYCILDTPPSLGVLMTSSLAASDEILTPLQCEWFGLEGLAKIIHVVRQIQSSGTNVSLRHEGILMTMYDGRTNLARQVVDQVKEHLPASLYQSIIPRAIRLGEAPSFGRTIFEHDPYGAAASAYTAAAKEFLTRRGVEISKAGKAKGKSK